MFLDLMRKHLKPKEVNDALTKVVQKSPPDFDAGDGGKQLTVDSDGTLVWKEYEPPSYSSTQEVKTGKKWIDGKEIFFKSYSGTTDGSTVEIAYTDISTNCDNICYLGNESFLIKNSGGVFPLGFYSSSANHFDFYFDNTTKKLVLLAAASVSGNFTVFVYFTKSTTTLINETNKKGR